MGPRTRKMEKPKNIKQTIKRMIKDFKSELILIIFVVVMSICSAILSVVAPIFLKNILESAMTPGSAESIIGITSSLTVSIVWSNFFKSFGIMLGIYILSAILAWVSQFLSASISVRYAYEMRQRIQRKLNKLPLSYFDRVPYGDTLSIGTNDVDNVSRNVQSIITQLFSSLTLFIGSLIAMFVIDYRLAFIAVASLPLTLLVVIFVSKFSGKQFTRYRNELGELNGKVEEDYAGFKIIKLFNKERDVEKEFDENNERMANADHWSQFLSGFIFPTTNFINNVCYVAVAVVAGVIGSAPLMITFFSFLSLFSRPFQQIGQIFSTIQSVMASGERVYALLDEEESVPEIQDCVTDEKLIKGQFEFKNVYFQYNKEKPLIENFNLHINTGDTVAIVGPTGAGKTTMVNLIMRFYELSNSLTKEDIIKNEIYLFNRIKKMIGKKEDTTAKDIKFDDNKDILANIELAKKNVISFYKEMNEEAKKENIEITDKVMINENLLADYFNDGQILLDGIPTSNYSRNCLRGSVGMVLQDTWLFKGSIMDNLLYGDQNATKEEIEKACKEAHVDHFISTLPGGYDFILNEDGTNISQGQRQLLTIARAIISKPKILILDEATSSVDTRTELQIQDALDKIMVNKTSFVIAHRLSTIKNAKLIIVMKKGHIVETGNHKELLAKNGFYAELYNSQFSGINPMAKQEDSGVTES